jgi:hypothetical protein
MTGPIVIERQATGCRVRVEACNPRRAPGGALAVDVRVTMYAESVAGTVVLLAAAARRGWARPGRCARLWMVYPLAHTPRSSRSSKTPRRER